MLTRNRQVRLWVEEPSLDTRRVCLFYAHLPLSRTVHCRADSSRFGNVEAVPQRNPQENCRVVPSGHSDHGYDREGVS